MRLPLPCLALLALLAPATAHAQRPDSTGRDSLPPALEDQQRRVRGEATSRAESPGGAGAASGRDLRWRAALGFTGGTTWGTGEGDLLVWSAPAPALSGGIAWRATPRLDAALALRVAASGPRAEDASGKWSPEGRVVVVDGALTIERRVVERLTLRAGAGAALVSGPGRLQPFAAAGTVAPLAELGAAVRVLRAFPLHLSVGAQFLRYGASGTAEAPAETGTVSRLIVEVRHGS